MRSNKIHTISVARQSGFTLVEVILAVAMTALLSLLAYSGLSQAINAAESVEQQSTELADIQLTMSVLERDIRHAVNRPITDGFGDQQAAFIGGGLNEAILMLSRIGWQNFSQSRRAEVQRVGYILEEDELWRENWLVLDRWSDDEQKQRVMLYKGIRDIQLSFLKPADQSSAGVNAEFEWLDNWPANSGGSSLPEAVQIEVEFEHFGLVKRIIEVVSPGSPAGAGGGGDS